LAGVVNTVRSALAICGIEVIEKLL
jgi:hypothetical protein